MEEQQEKPFESWSILELMSHRRLAGRVQEVRVAGAGFLRIDVPDQKDATKFVSQLYAPGAVYAITPTTEDVCRRYVEAEAVCHRYVNAQGDLQLPAPRQP